MEVTWYRRSGVDPCGGVRQWSAVDDVAITDTTNDISFLSGNVGIGGLTTSTSSAPYAKLTVQGSYGSQLSLFDVSTSTSALGTASSSLFRINANGNVGIGSSTPWAFLSVMGSSTNNTTPLFVISTSTGPTNFPLFYVSATTSGPYDFARVAIGTTTSWGGSAGLRDQLTVAGRIYSTWQYMQCGVGGAAIGNTSISVNTTAACGEYAFFKVGTNGGQFNPTASYPAAGRLVPGAGGAAAVGDGSALRSSAGVTVASSSPVFEARVRLTSASTTLAASSTINILGFTNGVNTADFSSTTNMSGIFFIASSTPNWQAVTLFNNTATQVDTGIATSTNFTNFRRFRIEVASNTAIITASFLVDGNVVANITTNIPSVPLSPMVSVAITGTTLGTGAKQPNMTFTDVASMQTWIDDPLNPGAPTGLEFVENPYNTDLRSSANIGAWYPLRDPSDQHRNGMIISLATTSANTLGVYPSHSPYDEHVLGVETTNSYQVMGLRTGAVPVAREGRVGVSVNLENGAIAIGDAIVTSSSVGIGMKASHPGYIIGHALEAFNPAVGIGVCTEGTATSTTASSTCVGMVTIELGLGYDAGVGGVFGTIVSSVTDVTQAVTDLASDIFTTGAQYTKLAVGKIVAQTGVIKDFFAQVLNILPGGSINVPAGNNQIAGSDTIPVGGTTYFVSNSHVTAGAKIFITPRSILALPIAVTEVTAGQGFTVTLAGQAPNDIPFDWFMLSTYNAGTGQSAPVQQSNGATGGGGTAPVVPGAGDTGSTTPPTPPTPPDASSTPSITPPPIDNSVPPPGTGTGTPTTL